MWSERHHSYWERDRYGSGNSLPPLPQLQAWDCLRLCGLGKGQFKAQNHVKKTLPCWGIRMLPIAVGAQVGHYISALPSPSVWRLPWSLGSRHASLAVPGMFVWAGPALQEQCVPSHHVAQTCHLCPFVLSNKKLLAAASFAPPFHLQSCVLKALPESGKSVLPRVRKDH